MKVIWKVINRETLMKEVDERVRRITCNVKKKVVF